MQSPRLAVILFLGLLPGVLDAQEPMLLEAESGVTEIAGCQILHRLSTCDTYHADGLSVTSEGTVLEIEGVRYLLEWSGPAYYLDSGAVVQPLGDVKSGLRGQRWLEVQPQEGRLHTTKAWRDLDADHSLSTSDKLVLDSGEELRVKDVRLHLRVRPVPGGRSPRVAGHSSERQ